MRFLILIILFFSLQFSAQTVYKTPSGAKYHLAGCRMVKNVSSALSIERAQNIGLSACGICRPPSNTRLGIMKSQLKKTHGVNSRNRCRGITKTGTRCKRNTRIGNDFCFQHLP